MRRASPSDQSWEGKMNEKFKNLFSKLDLKFEDQFGFNIRETSITKIVEYLYVLKDSSSLAVTRILFGMLMLWDIPDERGGAVMDKRWGDPRTCHFPLFPFIQALPMPYMAVVYATLWTGALGMMLGYKYRISAFMFSISHWYLLLIDKSFWNNHSYLFGLVGTLLAFTQAHCYWSIDAYKNPALRSGTVPYWNYFVLKYQFFILYFMAGVKKGGPEWLSGYSVQNLSQHWVFNPFRMFLSVSQTDYLVVHWFVFGFDLTVAMWMMYRPTRHCAMVFCALFHLMNSRLFAIGMFPWVCLATMPLFYPFDWPKTVWAFMKKSTENFKRKTLESQEDLTDESSVAGYNRVYASENTDTNDNDKDIFTTDNSNTKDEGMEEHIDNNDTEETKSVEDTNASENIKAFDDSKKITFLILFYVLVQIFLPFSHFITQGNNNWTNGLYGYSWDMMVHTWDRHSVVVKVVDNENHKEMFIDPFVFTLNDRWTRHGDMVYQLSHCLRDRFNEVTAKNAMSNLSNISIYVDVMYSMNGRFVQRMFDSKVDILRAKWSPFSPVPFLIPLLDDALYWRGVLNEIRENVYSWNNYTEVLFLAELPGYEMEKFISPELDNVTLTVLEGSLVFQPDAMDTDQGQSHKLNNGDQIKIDTDSFHKVLNVDDSPVYYMYIFENTTEALSKGNDDKSMKSRLPILQELGRRINNLMKFFYLLLSYIFRMLFDCKCD